VGQFWTPITPLSGSLLHADSQAKVQFDDDRRSWQINLNAPKDISQEYKLVVNLFCKTKESPCAKTYGFETQVDKIIPIQVR
jgi:hypothetical protein